MLRNLLTKVPKSDQPWVATMVRTIFDRPGPEEGHSQHARVVQALEAEHPCAGPTEVVPSLTNTRTP